MTSAAIMLLALGLEAAFGWPDAVYRRIRHPVVWLGGLIGFLERRLNRPHWTDPVRYSLGALTTAIVVSVAMILAWAMSYALPNTPIGLAFEALIAASLIASRSLYDHVAAVARPLMEGNLEAARTAVSHIVGRDPRQLDEAGITRASLESLAENASDGVIAPLFWGLVLGLPGLAGYKAINTLDSMIGHRTDRFQAFGGFAARLDDLANWIPARLTGGLFALAAFSPTALRLMVLDAPAHRSPNAGWPEGALAGALGVRLSGPRSYDGVLTTDPWLNGTAPDPSAGDIQKGLRLYTIMVAIAAVVLGLISLLRFS